MVQLRSLKGFGIDEMYMEGACQWLLITIAKKIGFGKIWSYLSIIRTDQTLTQSDVIADSYRHHRTFLVLGLRKAEDVSILPANLPLTTALHDFSKNSNQTETSKPSPGLEVNGDFWKSQLIEPGLESRLSYLR